MGGNWVFRNTNGMSSAYQLAAHQHEPRPDGLLGLPDAGRLSGLPPPHPGRGLLRRLRRPLRPARADHVQHRRRARGAARRAAGGCTLDTGETRDYRALLVANGHHWDPQLAERFEGDGRLRGRRRCTRTTTSATTRRFFAGKRVVVLGMGNSAMDIAVEATQTAERVFLAARRGAWIVPKYVFGRPLDQFVTKARVPLAVRQRFMETTLRAAVGTMERYGLPKPDHRPLEAHPTISDTILTRLTHGDITPKPNIARLTADTRGLRRRQRGARRTSSSTAPATRSASRSSTPRWSRRPTTTCRCTGACSTPTSPACTSSPCCSRSARRCRWPRRSRSGSATT